MAKSVPLCMIVSIFGLVVLAVFLVIGCYFIARVAKKQELREKHAKRMQREMLIVGTDMLGMKAPEEVDEEQGITPEKVVVVHMP